MRVFTEDRLRPAGRIVGGARRFLVARFRLQSGNQRAEEMCVEQRVEFAKALRLRRERGTRGATDVADLFRSEQIDRGEPSHCLFGCDGESRAPQQRGETEEVGDWTHRVVHACASARMASIFGAI